MTPNATTTLIPVTAGVASLCGDLVCRAEELLLGRFAARQFSLWDTPQIAEQYRQLGEKLLPCLDVSGRAEVRQWAEDLICATTRETVGRWEDQLTLPAAVTPLEPLIERLLKPGGPVPLPEGFPADLWAQLREAGRSGDRDAAQKCGQFLEAFARVLRVSEVVESPGILREAGYGKISRTEYLALLFVLMDWQPQLGGKGASPKAQKTMRVPGSLVQQTWPEMRTVGAALGDAPTGRRWREGVGETAMIHEIKNWPLQTRLSLELDEGKLLSWWGLPPTAESLRRELQMLSLDGIFLLNVLIGLALQEGQVTVSVSELIRAVGRGDEARRSAEHRRVIARDIWRAILLFNAISVVGDRPGVYKTRDKQVIDVSSQAFEALIRITGWVPGQVSIDRSEPPELVSYVCGPWIERVRGNDQILTHFGDVLKIAAIPSGQATGRWAKVIGLNLNQWWREGCSDAIPTHPGDDNRLSVRMSKLPTRRDLLMGDRYVRASPDPEELLRGNDPRRANQYWEKALAELKRIGQIGYCPRASSLRGRQDWQEEWLDEPLDIRPAKTWTADVLEIAKGKRAAKRAARGAVRQKPN